MSINQIFLFDNEDSDFNECIDKVKTKFPDSWTWDDILSEIINTFEVENIIHIQECETYGL